MTRRYRIYVIIFTIDSKRWRNDSRCGVNFKLPNGDISECNPNGTPFGPCCSDWGWCGITQEHCQCIGCTDYRQQQG